MLVVKDCQPTQCDNHFVRACTGHMSLMLMFKIHFCSTQLYELTFFSPQFIIFLEGWMEGNSEYGLIPWRG